VRSQHRGAGLGRLLATTIIDAAKGLGYETLKLDTLPQMKAAQRMYETLGFRETAAYNDNPVRGVRFLADSARTHSIVMCTRHNWVRFVDGIHFFARDRREEVRLLG